MSKSNLIKLSLLTVLLVLLSACGEITIKFIPPPIVTIDVTPGIGIYNAGFSTNYVATIKNQKQYVICDSKKTNLTYHFNYTNPVKSWSSFLKGVNTGTEKGQAYFTAADINDTTNRYIEVVYGIANYVAPLAVEPIETTAIVPVPKATVIGHTKLIININGYTKSHQLVSNEIPVVSNCQ